MALINVRGKMVTAKMRIDNRFILRRMHPLLGELITWEVLTIDGQMRLGIIRKMKDPYLIKKYGWKEIPVYYWIGSRFMEPRVAAGNTQREVLKALFSHYYEKQDEHTTISTPS